MSLCFHSTSMEWIVFRCPWPAAVGKMLILQLKSFRVIVIFLWVLTFANLLYKVSFYNLFHLCFNPFEMYTLHKANFPIKTYQKLYFHRNFNRHQQLPSLQHRATRKIFFLHFFLFSFDLPTCWVCLFVFRFIILETFPNGACADCLFWFWRSTWCWFGLKIFLGRIYVLNYLLYMVNFKTICF